jgi:hypothetical protein
MRKSKKKRLEAKGWKIGTVKEFLGLSDEESAYIKLAAGLRERNDLPFRRFGNSRNLEVHVCR